VGARSGITGRERPRRTAGGDGPGCPWSQRPRRHAQARKSRLVGADVGQWIRRVTGSPAGRTRREPPRPQEHPRPRGPSRGRGRAAMTWAELSEMLHASQLASGDSAPAAAPTGTADVTGIAYDSRRVQQGNVFVALKGQHADGTIFARQAIERGAIAVVSED